MNFEQARLNMVERQIKPCNIKDQTVLQLLSDIHREDFIPDEYRSLAFADVAIALPHNQSTMPPEVEAQLLQALQLKPQDDVLEIGTGCAYLTALLAKSCRHVVSIDIHPDFTEQARVKLQKYHIDNVTLESGNAIYGWKKYAPYDVIVFTGSVPFIDQNIKQQVNVRGRLFVIIGQSPVMQATLMTQVSVNNWHSKTLFETDIGELTGVKKIKSFKF